MSSQNVFLLDMPDLVLRNIMDYCDFHDIMKLRKTCRSLRNFIIYTSPCKSINKICVFIFPNSIRIELGLGYDFSYEDYNGGCILYWYKGEKKIWMREIDFITVASMDLTAFLESTESIEQILIRVRRAPLWDAQKPDCNQFKFMELIKTGVKSLFCWSNIKQENDPFKTEIRILNLFELLLKKRGRPLRVKKLLFEIKYPRGVMKILPYIASKDLERLEIFGHVSQLFEMSGIMELPVWKNLKWLQISNFHVDIPLTSFIHITRCILEYGNVSEENFDTLLEIMLTSEVKTRFSIWQTKASVQIEEYARINNLELVHQPYFPNRPFCIFIPDSEYCVHTGYYRGTLWIQQEKKILY